MVINLEHKKSKLTYLKSFSPKIHFELQHTHKRQFCTIFVVRSNPILNSNSKLVLFKHINYNHGATLDIGGSCLLTSLVLLNPWFHF